MSFCVAYFSVRRITLVFNSPVFTQMISLLNKVVAIILKRLVNLRHQVCCTSIEKQGLYLQRTIHQYNGLTLFVSCNERYNAVYVTESVREAESS